MIKIKSNEKALKLYDEKRCIVMTKLNEEYIIFFYGNFSKKEFIIYEDENKELCDNLTNLFDSAYNKIIDNYDYLREYYTVADGSHPQISFISDNEEDKITLKKLNHVGISVSSTNDFIIGHNGKSKVFLEDFDNLFNSLKNIDKDKQKVKE